MPHDHMNGSVDWKLLGRYLAGECSDEEAAALQAWTATDEEAARQLLEARHVWEVAGDEEVLPERVEAAWERFEAWRRRRERAGRPPGAASVSSRRSGRGPRRTVAHTRSRRGPLLRAGALVALLVLAGLLAMLLTDGASPRLESAQVKVFNTERGQRAIIDLVDGTRVRLNADSKLVLTAAFASGTRTVRLEGEAYFEVASDPEHPFTVNTKGAAVRVLGTAFGVWAYGDAGPTVVAVKEGEVVLQPAHREGTDTTAVLASRDLGVAAGGQLRAVRHNVDLATHLAWTKGRLVFEDAPFDEVACRLERWYDLRIDVRLPIDAIDKLNARFDNKSAREVLGDIALALDLHYERVGRKVTFSRRSAAASSASSRAYPTR